MDNIPSPLDNRGERLKESILTWLDFIPRFARTYVAVLLRPRWYLRAMGERRTPSELVSPPGFWLTNVVIVTALRTFTDENAQSLRHPQTIIDFVGLVVVTALCALFLVAILDIWQRRNLLRMLDILFACSVVFVPHYLVGLISEFGNFLGSLASRIIFGTPASVPWYYSLTLVLDAIPIIAWFLLLGLGIRVVFNKSKASIALGVGAIVAYAVIVLVFGIALAFLHGVRSWVTVAQAGGRARAALIQTPHDYVSAAGSFRTLYESPLRIVDRKGRLRARIGAAAANVAGSAVMAKAFEVEKKAYESQVKVLADDVPAAARLLFESVDLLRKDRPDFSMMINTDALREIKRMLTDELYDPDVEKMRTPKDTLHVPVPTPFP